MIVVFPVDPISQRHTLTTSISEHLGLSELPNDLLTCCPYEVSAGLGKLVKMARPSLVVIDSFTAHMPDMEEKNSIATKYYNTLRGIISDSPLLQESRRTFLHIPGGEASAEIIGFQLQGIFQRHLHTTIHSFQ